ncbi:MAG TPA: TetR/AcrR family transcriptional regulator [Candidatus Melainabacteria bacterium]|nr:TetR/AcrR family transcriptional regulator [Candidatus Melainabacteria bacterium]
MPRPRFKKLDKEKQQLILDVASEEFAAHGFENASYNAIIEKCKLSKGVMYYYFDDKLDLFQTILSEANQSYLEYIGHWKSCSNKDEFWAQIKEIFYQSMAFFEEDPRAARLVAMSMKHPEILSRTYEQLEAISSSWFIRVISEGQELGAVRDDIPMDYLLRLIFGMGQASDQWMLSKWQESSLSDLMKDAELVFKIFREFLDPA